MKDDPDTGWQSIIFCELFHNTNLNCCEYNKYKTISFNVFTSNIGILLQSDEKLWQGVTHSTCSEEIFASFIKTKNTHSTLPKRRENSHLLNHLYLYTEYCIHVYAGALVVILFICLSHNVTTVINNDINTIIRDESYRLFNVYKQKHFRKGVDISSLKN